VTVGEGKIDRLTLTAPGVQRLQADERGIPTGKTEPVAGTSYDFLEGRSLDGAVLDTGYTELVRGDDGLARVELVDTAQGGGVTLWMDHTYPYLMLFTGDSLTNVAKRRSGLGVEPMTCAPNALQTGEGLLTLEPGESFTSEWGIKPTTQAT
jgi:aldose 1-epimerase